MPLTAQEKPAIVAELSAMVSDAQSILAANYAGMNVAQVTELRARLDEAGCVVRVARNTLMRRAVVDTDYQCLADALVGQTILMFSQESPGAAARVVREYIKTAETTLAVRAIALNGELYDAKALDFVASLPTREEALGQLAAVLAAPANKLAQTLNEPACQLARALSSLQSSQATAA